MARPCHIIFSLHSLSPKNHIHLCSSQENILSSATLQPESALLRYLELPTFEESIQVSDRPQRQTRPKRHRTRSAQHRPPAESPAHPPPGKALPAQSPAAQLSSARRCRPADRIAQNIRTTADRCRSPCETNKKGGQLDLSLQAAQA